jgi:hypothetical protein
MYMIGNPIGMERFTFEFAQNSPEVGEDVIASILCQVWQSVLCAEDHMDDQAGVGMAQGNVSV